MPSDVKFDGAGFEFCCTVVPAADMFDRHDHLSITSYAVLFEGAAKAVLPQFDLSRAYRERTNRALFAAETHMVFHREVRGTGAVSFYFRVLDLSERSIKCMYFMVDNVDGILAATQEILYLHVDLEHRRVMAIPDHQLNLLEALLGTHQRLPEPQEVGRRIMLHR